MGNPKAAVRVVMYQDLECPKCALWHRQLLQSIIPAYGARVAFEFRDFHIPSHPWSYNAAVLARFLDTRNPALGLSWRDYCFTHQNDITPAQLQGAFSRPDLFAKLQYDNDLALRDHLTGTPFVLVNGVAVPDSPTTDTLVAAIQAALAKS